MIKTNKTTKLALLLVATLLAPTATTVTKKAQAAAISSDPHPGRTSCISTCSGNLSKGIFLCDLKTDDTQEGFTEFMECVDDAYITYGRCTIGCSRIRLTTPSYTAHTSNNYSYR